MTEKAYWKWLADYVEQKIHTNPFLNIHPFEPRKVAASVWGFDIGNFTAVAQWQHRFQSKINSTINRVAKTHGLRLGKSTGYARLIRIAKN